MDDDVVMDDGHHFGGRGCDGGSIRWNDGAMMRWQRATIMDDGGSGRRYDGMMTTIRRDDDTMGRRYDGGMIRWDEDVRDGGRGRQCDSGGRATRMDEGGSGRQ